MGEVAQADGTDEKLNESSDPASVHVSDIFWRPIRSYMFMIIINASLLYAILFDS